MTHNFTLIENAQDSLEHAISHLSKTNPLSKGDCKRVILDLSHVVELLFKERLRQIHPAFILSNVDKYPSKTAYTVGTAEAFQRLIKIGGIDFKDEDKSALKTIREKRNEIEHYEFKISEKESKITIGSVLAFIFRFSFHELNLDWFERRTNDPSWVKLNEFAEFFESQREMVLDQLADSQLALQDCPLCHSETFDMEAEVCILCGYREEVVECKICKGSYLESDVEYPEAGLCEKCEWEDGYASAHYEKY